MASVLPAVSSRHDLSELASLARPVSLARERVLPVGDVLRPLLAEAGLRRGLTCSVSGSTSLALALLAEASAAGCWCAAVGVPELGLVAAAEMGIALERLALIPSPPPEQWAPVVAALVDGIDIVLVRPAGRSTTSARRLSARARERGTVLVLLGAAWWPAELNLYVLHRRWSGLGEGHGNLEGQVLEVASRGRGAASRDRRATVHLPVFVGDRPTYMAVDRPINR